MSQAETQANGRNQVGGGSKKEEQSFAHNRTERSDPVLNHRVGRHRITGKVRTIIGQESNENQDPKPKIDQPKNLPPIALNIAGFST